MLINCFPKIYQFAFTYPCPRKLREIMKMSLIERENKEKVVQIWMDYHKERDSTVSYALSKKEYEQLSTNSTHSPMCLLPIKR